MAHYGLPPLSYKPATAAEFMLLALRVFTDDRRTALRLEERVHDVLLELQVEPTTRAVGAMLARTLQKSALTVNDRQSLELTVADLLFLSRGRGYRYTKIVGGREFKFRIDETLVKEMEAFTVAGVKSDPRALSILLAHMVKLDLYSHFYLNAPPVAGTLPALQPFAQATLYLALKSFLMAKRDVFDPELQGLGTPLHAEAVQSLQRFLQIHGIYRFSDWFPKASTFLTEQFGTCRQEQPELRVADLSLVPPEPIQVYLRAWQVRRWNAVEDA